MPKRVHIGVLLIVIFALSLMQTASAISVINSNVIFEEIDSYDNVDWYLKLMAEVPDSVQEAANNAKKLIEQHNATVKKLNAAASNATYIYGPIVSTSPFTVEYKSPVSEYVKIGKDYIYVTTYYHAIIDNPGDGEESNGYYKGYHILTADLSSGNTKYRYYGSCGNEFYALYRQQQAQFAECKIAIQAFKDAQEGVFEETSTIVDSFEKQYSPLFVGYRNIDADRPMVECLQNDYNYGAKYSTGPTVFKVGCPAYVNGEGILKAIEYDGMNRPKLNTVPAISNGSTMVPIRPLIDGLTNSDTFHGDYFGVSVTYDGETKKILVQTGADYQTPVCMKNTTIELMIGSKTAYVNGEPYEMAQPAQIINGKTMVPLRAVSEMLNCDVEWIQDGQYIVVTPMSIQEFANMQDEFLQSLSEIDVNGDTYEYVEKDEVFFDASYIIPNDYISVDRAEESVVITYSHESNGKHYQVSIIAADASKKINEYEVGNQFWWVLEDEEPQLTIEEFCNYFGCYEWVFENIVIEREAKIPSIYYLSTENNVVTAVTELKYSALLESFVPIGESLYNMRLDADLLKEEAKEFYAFLSTFRR